METYLFTAAGSIFAFAALSATTRKDRFKQLPFFFLAFMVLVLVRCVFWLLVHAETPLLGGLWLSLLMGSTLLITPCVWLFAKEIDKLETPRLGGLSFWHFAVLVAGLVCLTPMLAGVGIKSLHKSYSYDMWLLVNWANFFCALIYALQAPCYWYKSARILQKNSNLNARQLLLKGASNPNLNALRLMLISIATTWLISVLLVIHCATLGGPSHVSLFLSSIEVIVAVGAILFVMHSMPYKNREQITVNRAALESKYARSSLSSSDRKRILVKIEQAMNQQCYLNNMLTLRALSDQINEKPHYVSQVINQDLDTSFFEMINQHRIHYAKELIKRQPDTSILTVSEDSGFNSKTTFNSAFRKYTQMTPSQFKAVQ